MRTEEYFRSLSDECETLRNRVRFLINDAHWPTDGEWKESVLRSMIRRSAPQSITVGRGFVVNHERCSSQIDVLLYDNTLPILYKDGDLVFVTPSSCRAIIEVKTRVSAQQFQAASEKLADDAEFIRSTAIGYPLFVGLFAYELNVAGGRRLLESLKTVASGNEKGLSITSRSVHQNSLSIGLRHLLGISATTRRGIYTTWNEWPLAISFTTYLRTYAETRWRGERMRGFRKKARRCILKRQRDLPQPPNSAVNRTLRDNAAQRLLL